MKLNRISMINSFLDDDHPITRNKNLKDFSDSEDEDGK